MKQKIIFTLIFLAVISSSYAQKYITKTGCVYFKSRTDAIDIDGSNNKVAAMLDMENGELVAIVLIKAFELPLATADKHFNETYMESDKYPKATFKGKILDYEKFDLNSNSTQEITIQGNLDIHGTNKQITQKTMVTNNNGKLVGKCELEIEINDYGIKVPNNVKDRVAKTIEVKIELVFEEMKK